MSSAKPGCEHGTAACLRHTPSWGQSTVQNLQLCPRGHAGQGQASRMGTWPRVTIPALIPFLSHASQDFIPHPLDRVKKRLCPFSRGTEEMLLIPEGKNVGKLLQPKSRQSKAAAIAQPSRQPLGKSLAAEGPCWQRGRDPRCHAAPGPDPSLCPSVLAAPWRYFYRRGIPNWPDKSLPGDASARCGSPWVALEVTGTRCPHES